MIAITHIVTHAVDSVIDILSSAILWIKMLAATHMISNMHLIK